MAMIDDTRLSMTQRGYVAKYSARRKSTPEFPFLILSLVMGMTIIAGTCWVHAFAPSLIPPFATHVANGLIVLMTLLILFVLVVSVGSFARTILVSLPADPSHMTDGELAILHKHLQSKLGTFGISRGSTYLARIFLAMMLAGTMLDGYVACTCIMLVSLFFIWLVHMCDREAVIKAIAERSPDEINVMEATETQQIPL